MVQIQLPEQEKPLEQKEEEVRGDVERGVQQQGEAPLLPTSVRHPVPRERRQTTNKR